MHISRVFLRPRAGQHFQTNGVYLEPLLLQMGLEGRQQLPQFGSGSIAADKQTPRRAFNGAGLNRAPQSRRNQGIERTQTLSGLPHELAQLRQSGRFLCRLQQGLALVVSSHGGHVGVSIISAMI